MRDSTAMPDDGRATPAVDPEILRFYSENTLEHDRLDGGRGRLEFTRTQELLRGALPAAPARVLDVGGGPGRYAAWLASEGYEVTLVDPVPALVRHARERAAAGPSAAFEAVEGDARALAAPDGSADAVLLL